MSLLLETDELSAWLSGLETPAREQASVPSVERKPDTSDRAKAVNRRSALAWYRRAMQDPEKRRLFAARKRARYRANPEQKKAADAAYARTEAGRASRQRSNRKWRAANRAKVNAYNRAYRARRNNPEHSR
jgi:hypothetical protein